MTPTPPTTISRWTDADRTGDLAGMRACLAADARLISPLTDGFSFHGAEEVMAVFAAARVASGAARPLGWIVRGVEKFLMPRLR